MTDANASHPLLNLVITQVTQLTASIKGYELRAVDGAELPAFTAGSHLKIPVTLNNGTSDVRHYSISSDPQDRTHYDLAVLLETKSRGGSHYIHQHFSVGTTLQCAMPINYFHLEADSSPAILIAGGVGITPIKAMVHSLAARGRRFQLHYAGRSETQMAYLSELKEKFPQQLFIYASDQQKKLSVAELIESAPSNAHFYVCGPQGLMEEVETNAVLFGFPRDRIHTEHFVVETQATDQPLILELARSNKMVKVEKNQSLLEALRDADVNVYYDCCVGECGTCAVKILEGEADHRDHVLSDQLKEKGFICVCVSRAKSEKLILDI